MKSIYSGLQHTFQQILRSWQPYICKLQQQKPNLEGSQGPYHRVFHQTCYCHSRISKLNHSRKTFSLLSCNLLTMQAPCTPNFYLAIQVTSSVKQCKEHTQSIAHSMKIHRQWCLQHQWKFPAWDITWRSFCVVGCCCSC